MDPSLHNLLEQTRRIGTWTVDVVRSHVQWSPATYAIHEEDPGKVINLDDGIRYYVPEHRPIIEKCVQDSIELQRPWDVELQIQTAKGNVRWVRAIGQPRLVNGTLVQLQGIFEDIHERKSLAVEHETLLRRMLDGERIANLGHWYWDIAAKTLEWTPGVYRMFGLPEDRPAPQLKEYLPWIHPDDRGAFEHTLEHAVKTASAHKVDFRLLRDGQEKHIRSEAFPQHDADGRLRGFVGVAIDRTKEVEAGQQIETLNRRLTLALDASRIGVWEWDVRTNDLIWDESMYELFGIPEHEFTGAYEAWENGLHPEDKPGAVAQLEHAISSKSKFEATFRIICPSGVERTIQGIGDLVLDQFGEPCRMIGVNWDISEVVNIRRELERSNEELVQFAYRTSHDLKAPLTTIRRLASYAIQDASDGMADEVARNVEAIEHRAAAMETMVLGILDAAKADLTDTPAEEIDLESIVQDIADAHRAHCEEHEVTLRWSIACKTQPSLPRVRVQQILTNLISNGIKYASTERSERFVQLQASLVEDRLVLTVEDNGTGIPGTDEAEPFQMFRRFHSGVSGSGLGLYIVKKHVDALAGTIRFVTAATGTRFDLELPLRT